MKTDLMINLSPKSLFSESIRSIRTSLAFSGIGKKYKTILITSPEPHNGKSFIIANLAVAYAQEGKKVLIIDADLRNGRQNQIFEINNTINGGYTNLILNYDEEDEKKIILSDFVKETKINGVWLLPNGPIPPNPVELLSSNNNEKALEYLKNKFDIILIDCPPTIGLSDTMIMAKYSDLNLVVVGYKETKMEALRTVAKTFEQSNKTINGVIINKTPHKNTGYYGYYIDEFYGNTSIRKKKNNLFSIFNA